MRNSSSMCFLQLIVAALLITNLITSVDASCSKRECCKECENIINNLDWLEGAPRSTCERICNQNIEQPFSNIDDCLEDFPFTALWDFYRKGPRAGCIALHKKCVKGYACTIKEDDGDIQFLHEACRSKKYQDHLWSEECKECKKSKPFSDPLQGPATKCTENPRCDSPEGTFFDTENAECKQCPKGYFQEKDSTQDKCKRCPKGFFQEDDGEASCIECEAGRYADVEASVSCVDCEDGKAGDERATSVDDCEPCVKGQWTNDGAGNACEPCAEGYFCSGETMEQCTEPNYCDIKGCQVDGCGLDVDRHVHASSSFSPKVGPLAGGTTITANLHLSNITFAGESGLEFKAEIGGIATEACVVQGNSSEGTQLNVTLRCTQPPIEEAQAGSSPIVFSVSQGKVLKFKMISEHNFTVIPPRINSISTQKISIPKLKEFKVSVLFYVPLVESNHFEIRLRVQTSDSNSQDIPAVECGQENYYCIPEYFAPRSDIVGKDLRVEIVARYRGKEVDDVERAKEFVFRIEPPTITRIEPPEVSSAGTQTITIKGTHWAENPASPPAVLIGNIPCSNVQQQQDSTDILTLQCRPEHPIRSGEYDVQVSINHRSRHYSSNKGPKIRFVDPSVNFACNTASTRRSESDLFCENKIPLDGDNLTIFGRHFGGAQTGNILVLIGEDSLCIHPEQQNNNQLSCTDPGGHPGEYVVHVSAGSGMLGTARDLSGAAKIIRVAPIVEAVIPNSGPTGGGTEVFIKGNFFGSAQSSTSLEVRLGNVDLCLHPKVVNESFIMCVTPPYRRADILNVSVLKSGFAGVTNGQFQYFAACYPGQEFIEGLGCRECAIGRYGMQSEDGSQQCIDCPQSKGSLAKGIGSLSYSANCNAPGLSGNEITATPGFWIADRAEPPLSFATCFWPDSCLGGQSSADGERIRAKCAEGHRDDVPVCGLCEKGYAATSSGCIKCYSESANYLISGMLLLLLVILAISMVMRAKNERAALTIIVRIFISWLHTLLIVGSFRIRGPAFIQGIFDIAETATIISLETVPLQCVLKLSYLEKFYVYATSVIAIPVICFIVVFLIYGVRKLRSRAVGVNTHSHHSLATHHIHLLTVSCVVLLFAVYTIVAMRMFSLFSCWTIPGATPERRLRGDVTQPCGIATPTIVASLVIILFVVGGPLFSVYFLHRKKGMLRHMSFRQRFGFLYFGYKTDLFFWEGVVVARKILLAAISSFAYEDSFYSCFVATAVLTVFLCLQIKMSPFILRGPNNLEALSLVSATATQFFSLLYYIRPNMEVTVTVCLLLLNISTLFMFIGYAVIGQCCPESANQASRVYTKHLDPATETEYYYCEATGECFWQLPKEGLLEDTPDSLQMVENVSYHGGRKANKALAMAQTSSTHEYHLSVIPEGWSRQYDDEGNKYYAHDDSGHSQWEKPGA